MAGDENEVELSYFRWIGIAAAFACNAAAALFVPGTLAIVVFAPDHAGSAIFCWVMGILLAATGLGAYWLLGGPRRVAGAYRAIDGMLRLSAGAAVLSFLGLFVLTIVLLVADDLSSRP